MSQEKNKYQFRTNLLRKFKASPAGACLKLFLRKVHTKPLRWLLVPALILTLGITIFAGSTAVYAHPTDSKEACEAAGGTWTLVTIDNCTGYTEDGSAPANSSKEACEAAGKQWLVFPLIPGQNCVDKPGANSKANSMNLADQALSYTYLNALVVCVQKSENRLSDRSWALGDFDHTNNAHAKAGDWFLTHTEWNFNDGHPWHTAASYLSPGVNKSDDKGKTMCNDIVKQAVKLWSYPTQGGRTAPHQLLCDMGVKRADGDSCETGVSGFKNLKDHWEGLVSAVKSKVYGGVKPSIKNEHRYLMFKEAFMKGCSPTKSTTAADDFKYTVTLVSDNGTKSQETYEGKKHDTKRFAYTSNEYVQLEYTCKQIADKMNEFANAYALYRADNQNESPTPSDSPDDTAASGEESKPTCVVDGVGWLVCPIVEFMGSITDSAYKGVETLLETPPLLTTGDNSGAYQAWRIMQGFANASFVVVFLVIIFSQLTSAGVSNYGVKRMLPRLVIGAILVNVSFFICAVAVDLSNIIGGSIKPMLDSISIPAPTSNVFTDPSFADGTMWTPIIAVVLAGSASAVAVGTVGFWGALALLVPGLLAAIAAILTVLVVLVIRQALIILLVVVSPLAFVAFLLPNTEGLFTKWRKLLTTLLIMYPVIAAIFGLAGLASVIVINSAPDNPLTQIAGALISVIPLAITPVVMKSAGGLLSRAGLIVNNKQKGLFDRANNAASGFRKDQATRKSIQAFGGGKGPVRSFRRWNARRGMISSNRQNELSRSKNEYLAGALTATGEDGELTSTAASLQNRAAGGGLVFGNASESARQRVAATAASAVKSATEEEIKNVKLSADFKPGALGDITSAFKEAVKSGDTVKARAYQDMLQSSGGPGIKAWRDAITGMEADASSGMSNEGMSNALRKRTMETNPGIKSSDAAAAKWATSQAAGKNSSLADIRKDAGTWSGLSNEELMGQKSAFNKATGEITGAMGDALKQGAITRDRAIAMQAAESFNKMSEEVRAEINKIASSSSQQGV